ncbi:MAG: ADP-ribosylglycohydrolase family protein [Flagellimonas sp.]
MKMRINNTVWLAFIVVLIGVTGCSKKETYVTMDREQLLDKIKGAWAAQTIGVTYGGPTEFHYTKSRIPDSVNIAWSDSSLYHMMTDNPAVYDDIYMDLTFVEVMEEHGLNAPAIVHAEAYANAGFWLWHANQQGRYNFLNGMSPPDTGHWLNNPHADDIDFQIESDFIGIMNPGMPNSAKEYCDKIGHIMNSGDGYYGGLFVAGMYTNAFVDDNISSVIKNALALIPPESTFYQCISDVVEWHVQYPEDWKTNWELLENKWGNDIGCPSGVLRDYNIDAKINAAYVVMGLLYGNGNFGRTMEIATRCGQDSDCNPATAGAILGTILGYENLPTKWTLGLKSIEHMDFMHTKTSLKEVYDISFRHALLSIKEHGGTIGPDEVKIKLQSPVTAPLEQNFIGYFPHKRVSVNKELSMEGNLSLELDFAGIGVVLTGKAGNKHYRTKYALETDEETLGGYIMEVDFFLDGDLIKTMHLPLQFLERSYEVFFQYELDPGPHHLKLVVKNPLEDAYLEINDIITYKKTETTND